MLWGGFKKRVVFRVPYLIAYGDIHYGNVVIDNDTVILCNSMS